MIISKTPLRISFFGGGTDLPDFINYKSGAVIGSAINKYIYVTINKFESKLFDHSIRLNYSNIEHVKSLTEIKHKPCRKILEYFNLSSDIEIHVVSDLPAYTGLGSSSSFTVGLINSLSNYSGKFLNNHNLCKLAINIEQNILKESVGSQDQSFASYGGLNLFRFTKKSILVKKINISDKNINKLNSNLLLYYTGIKRRSNDIESKKINNLKKNKTNFEEILNHVFLAEKLLSNSNSFDDFGLLMHETWQIKKKLHQNVSNSVIDDIYTKGLKAGALGGKLLGAGSGGFILFYVPLKDQSKFRSLFNTHTEISFKLNAGGSEIIFNNEK